MKSSPKKILLKSGQKVFDKQYGDGVVVCQCHNTFTASFDNRVAYYYADGTELGSNLRGDRPGALLDDLHIDAGLSRSGYSFWRWLLGAKV